jgi:hypothetical protein
LVPNSPYTGYYQEFRERFFVHNCRNAARVVRHPLKVRAGGGNVKGMPVW